MKMCRIIVLDKEREARKSFDKIAAGLNDEGVPSRGDIFMRPV